MRAFIDTIYDLLIAEKVPGGKLEGIVTISKDPTLSFKPDDFPLIMIAFPKDRPLVNRATGYKVYEAQAGIWAAVAWSKNKKDYVSAEAAAENWGDLIQDILLTDPELKTATYPNGFSVRDESTRFGDLDAGPDVMSGVAVAVQRLPFMTECLKRNLTITQQ